MQRPDAGEEAVFAAPVITNRGSPFTRRRNGFRGDGEVPVPSLARFDQRSAHYDTLLRPSTA